MTGFRLLLGATLLLFTWLALTPAPIDLHEVPQGDKWAHAAAYLLLALLLDRSWPELRFGLPQWLFLLGYGLAIELVQGLIPTRFFSLLDLLANASGIAIYAFGLLPILRRIGLHRIARAK